MLARQKTEQFGKNIIEIQQRSGLMITAMIIGGLGALYFGGEWVVDGAVSIAKFFGMSEYVISLTVVAVGTSLPELATSIVAARKNDSDLAIGNVIGSNIFNIFWILGISALIVPLSFPVFATIDLLVLLGISLLLFFFMFIGRHHELERWQGYTFLFIYIGYTTFLLTR
jgi:cation:H+ antiporter